MPRKALLFLKRRTFNKMKGQIKADIEELARIECKISWAKSKNHITQQENREINRRYKEHCQEITAQGLHNIRGKIEQKEIYLAVLNNYVNYTRK